MELLKNFIKEFGITEEKKYDDFCTFNSLILEWNKKVNVISRKNISTENIILNSIFFLTKFEFLQNAKVLDIGTGGGFPGIPLKILYPEADVTLCDSIRKKINVVDDIIKRMKFDKAEAVCSRAEDLAALDKYYRKFDYIVSKSVAPLENLYEWGRNLIKNEGMFLCIKGGEMSEEIAGLKKRNKNISVEIINYSFPEIYSIEDKKLVIIKKIKV